MPLDRCPEECVGWIVWNADTGEMRLVFPGEVSSGCSHVRYHATGCSMKTSIWWSICTPMVVYRRSSRPRMIVMTAGEFKIAGVIGNCDRGQCSTAFRLCANGLFLPLAFDSTGLNGQTGGNDGYPSSFCLNCSRGRFVSSVIGAGGTGSQMLMGLAQLHTAMIALGHPGGLDVTVIDSDQVSEANVGRQMFYPSDVGLCRRPRYSSIASTWRWAPAGRRRSGA